LALKAAPSPLENVDNLFHLGQLYKRIRQFEPACECFETVLKLQPEQPGAMIVLSQVYRQLGQMENTIAIYDRLLALQPNDPSLLLGKALSLPMLYASSESLLAWRQDMEKQLDAMLAMTFPENHLMALHGSSFYLAYQGLNDRELALKIGQVFQKLLPPVLSAGTSSARTAGKPRIGIISRFLSPSHTVGRFMQGIIQHLSREKFQVIIFSVGNETAYVSDGTESPEDCFINLPSDNIQQAARQITEQKPDILFYADLGMNVTTYCLAGLRLAPVQCVTWGHPVTSGLSTVDYFISSRAAEPENAQAHYSEQLVLLDRLPTYYYRPKAAVDANQRQTFGLSESAHLYICPQSLFKFHPDFDAILAAILQGDADGELILVSHYSAAVNQQLLERFKTTMPDVLERVRILPRIGREDFLKLLSCADVLLDPIHFGGGNTSYEALALGIPIVTWPSAFMRGRATAACYLQMDLTGLTVHSAEEYVALALKLATDKQYREVMRAEILSKNNSLYEDEQVIVELEDFFLKALSDKLAK
jgi:protein O-GlcNAc transferase